MLRRLSLFCLTVTAFMLRPERAAAQLFYSGTEYGITFGGSQYFGDLNDNYGFKTPHPVGGVFVRHLLSQYIALRANASLTRVSYSDANSSNVFNRMRNLNFSSNIAELSIQSEFNFTRFATGEDGHRFTPYLTGGIGVFYYNPTSEYEGKVINLRKAGTEGQNLPEYGDRKYKSVSVCFPVGAGFKYWVTPGFNLGFEIANRLTLTDYMDDVSTTFVGSDKFANNPDFPNPAYYLQDRSANQELGYSGKQRGNSASFDQYLYAVFNLSFQLKVYHCPNYQREAVLD